MAGINRLVKVIAKHYYGGDVSGSHEEAVAHFWAAIALRPARLPHHTELGKVLLKLGRRREAEAAFRRALACEIEDTNGEMARRGAARALAALRAERQKQKKGKSVAGSRRGSLDQTTITA